MTKIYPNMSPFTIFQAWLVIVTASARISPDTCGKNHSNISNVGRIVSGRPVAQSLFPFMVSLTAYKSALKKWIHKCGGNIINAGTVLTACHCIAADNKVLSDGEIHFQDVRRLMVVAGTGNWWTGSPTMQTSRVWRTIPHPKCHKDNGIIINDLAIVQLERKLVYSKHVQPMRVVSLSVSEAMVELKRLIKTGKTCYTPGWGVTSETGLVSRRLLVASTRLLSSEECRKTFCSASGKYCKVDFAKMGHVCVFNPKANPCFGDSGGPLVCDGMVFGTTAYGLRCIPGYPAVYQNVVTIIELMGQFGFN